MCYKMLQMPDIADMQIDIIVTALGRASSRHYIHLAAWYYLITNGAGDDTHVLCRYARKTAY
jgi:hypothetical protein